MNKPFRFLARLAFALSVLAAGATPAAAAGNPPQPVTHADASTDLAIEVLKVEPANGSTLTTPQPIRITFRYRFSKPGDFVRLFAKVLEDGVDATYEGSPGIDPGTGVVRRAIYLTKPGKVHKVTIVAKNSKSAEIFTQEIPVDYTWVADPAGEAARRDGSGSRILGLTFSPASPATLKPGTRVDVKIDYDIVAAQGLHVWAEPVTGCNTTFAPFSDFLQGRGAVHGWITIGEKCTVTQVKAGMTNAAGIAVVQKVFDVDLRYAE